jgi:hypothetical protein
MVLVVAYTTHISRKAISSALLTNGDETTVEMAADPDVAELLRWGQAWGGAGIGIGGGLGEVSAAARAAC